LSKLEHKDTKELKSSKSDNPLSMNLNQTG
jgi:hypothetical protein